MMSKLMMLAQSAGKWSEDGQPLAEGGMALDSASTMSGEVDTLFYFITALSVFFFILIVGCLVYFVAKYKHKGPEDKTHPLEGNFRLEVAWSVIPAILLVIIFAWGFRDFMKLAVPPGDAYEIRVVGKKWSWSFTYPSGVESNDLVVPANRPVKLVMNSTDVIHSFFIPDFRVKKDVIPNRYSVLWFQAPEPGIFQFQCTEYCGTEHSMMGTRYNEKEDRYVNFVKVLPEEEFNAWLESGGPLGEAEQEGEDGEIVSSTNLKAPSANFGEADVNKPFTIIDGEERKDLAIAQVVGPNEVKLKAKKRGETLQLEPKQGVTWRVEQDPVKKGDLIFNKLKGCNSCHGLNGEKKTGPALNDLWCSTEQLVGGGSVNIRGAEGYDYIKTSILNPGKDIVQGYGNKMPSFANQMGEGDVQVDYITEYLKSQSSKWDAKNGTCKE